MKISTRSKKVRATELRLAAKGAKVAILTIRRWIVRFRTSSETDGKTGSEIPIDGSANRENEINEARVAVEMHHDEAVRKRTIDDLNEDESRNIDEENLENELREMMSGITGMTDSHRRA